MSHKVPQILSGSRKWEKNGLLLHASSILGGLTRIMGRGTLTYFCTPHVLNFLLSIFFFYVNYFFSVFFYFFITTYFNIFDYLTQASYFNLEIFLGDSLHQIILYLRKILFVIIYSSYSRLINLFYAKNVSFRFNILTF